MCESVYVCVCIKQCQCTFQFERRCEWPKRNKPTYTANDQKPIWNTCAYLWLLYTQFHDLVIIAGYQNNKSDLIKLMAIWLFIVFELSAYYVCRENTDEGKWTDNANFIQCEIIVSIAILCCERWSRWSAHQWFFCVIEKKKKLKQKQTKNWIKKKQRNALTRDIHE